MISSLLRYGIRACNYLIPIALFELSSPVKRLAVSTPPKPEVVAPIGAPIDSTDRLQAEVFTGHDDSVPGLRWPLSDDARQTLRAIDDNIGAAEQISGHLTVG